MQNTLTPVAIAGWLWRSDVASKPPLNHGLPRSLPVMSRSPASIRSALALRRATLEGGRR